MGRKHLWPLALSGIFVLSGCSFLGNSSSGGFASSEETNPLEAYTLPENFFMNYTLYNASIYGGDDWYMLTAKIGNDWQYIVDNHDEADEQYFFRSTGEDEFQQYTLVEGTWEKDGLVSTKGMMAVSLANFSFLYTVPDSPIVDVTTTETTFTVYGVERPAYLYTYTDYNDYTVYVDLNYPNIILDYSEHLKGSTNYLNERAEYYRTDLIGWETMANSSYNVYGNMIMPPESEAIS